ncbi:glycosyltransferase [Oceanibaculum pacificum]|uniref:Glycosyltransferase 2-like domain-containing protein n=1 Tax=Oceanibaculum pacificum TaxID=580166 RepID=A0A154VYV5_9PROT|nr:glycosyltransferase [Oceanibaculum pacificum]KZD06417.1 hypothetical protein AUP43_10865 [Oceanibaculum pacificum]
MRVSLVIPSLNQGRFLAEALAGALKGPDAADQVLVRDNLSTDDTETVLAGFKARHPDRLHVVREADGGQADALNKGFAAATGDLVGWLNADDRLTAGALARLRQAARAQPESVLFHGRAALIDSAGAPLGPYPVRPDGMLYDFSAGCFLCQPTVFLRREALALLGPLDTGLQTAMDLDLWLRAFRRYPGRIGFIEAVQAAQRMHADAKTHRLRPQVFAESMRVLHRHGLPVPQSWPLTYAAECGTEGPGWAQVAVAYEGVAGPEALRALYSHPSLSSRAR